VPKPRPEIRVTFSPQDGELHVEGDFEAVKRFMEWYLDMVKKLQQAQAKQLEQQQEQPKPEPKTPAKQETAKPRIQQQKTQPEAMVDTTGLPSFAQDNPWLGILSKKH